MTDPQFIERLRNGEETAFYQLVEDWKDRIYNTALGLVQQSQDAEDITQEVFITAWKNINRFRGESS
ncbi:MAG TPA: sigma factor, partial [Flavihumibacter sp.]